MDPVLVYFSSVSETTHRFVQKLGLPAIRIPIRDAIEVHDPYVLVLPTYGSGRRAEASGFVPKQVIKFLNNENNRSLIRGVIVAGNTQFGAEYCYAGDVVSSKCNVPYLYRFEMMEPQRTSKPSAWFWPISGRRKRTRGTDGLSCRACNDVLRACDRACVAGGD